jgi:hypothetical protein
MKRHATGVKGCLIVLAAFALGLCLPVVVVMLL